MGYTHLGALVGGEPFDMRDGGFLLASLAPSGTFQFGGNIFGYQSEAGLVQLHGVDFDLVTGNFPPETSEAFFQVDGTLPSGETQYIRVLKNQSVDFILFPELDTIISNQFTDVLGTPLTVGEIVELRPVDLLDPSLPLNIDGTIFNDTLVLGVAGGVAAGDDGDDLVIGDIGNDTLLGDAGNASEEIGGNDLLQAGPGSDVLVGGAGADTLYGEADADQLDGGSGADTLFGGVGDDSAFAGAGNDTLYGGADADTLSGGSNADLLYGGSEADELAGEDGADTLFGDAGEDVLFGGLKADTLYGGDEDDELQGGDGGDVLYGGEGVLSGNNLLIGDAGDDVLYAGDGNDTALGVGDNDVIYGGDGDDLLEGGSGDDSLFGGEGEFGGNDTLIGDGGNDVLYSGAGNDSVFAAADDDVVFGGEGNDLLEGGGGNDVLYGGEGEFGGNDVLIGNAGEDSLFAEAGDDSVFAGENNDILYGGTGNDDLHGDDGEDVIYGGVGDDTLHGDADNDVLYGADGSDLFIGIFGNVSTGNNSLYGGSNVDYLNLNTVDVVSYAQPFALYRATPIFDENFQAPVWTVERRSSPASDKLFNINEINFTDKTLTEEDAFRLGAVGAALRSLGSAFNQAGDVIDDLLDEEFRNQFRDSTEDPAWFKRFTFWFDVARNVVKVGNDLLLADDQKEVLTLALVGAVEAAVFPVIDTVVDKLRKIADELPEDLRDRINQALDEASASLKDELLLAARQAADDIGTVGEIIGNALGEWLFDFSEQVRSQIEDQFAPELPDVPLIELAPGFDIDAIDVDLDLFENVPIGPCYDLQGPVLCEDVPEIEIQPDALPTLLTLSTGDGTITGTSSALNGLRVQNFQETNSILITEATFSSDDITVTTGSAILDIDLDQDGASDIQITLEGDFLGAEFSTATAASGTEISVSFSTRTLTGTEGDDDLVGSGRDEVFLPGTNDGFDQVKPGGGNDLVDISGAGSGDFYSIDYRTLGSPILATVVGDGGTVTGNGIQTDLVGLGDAASGWMLRGTDAGDQFDIELANGTSFLQIRPGGGDDLIVASTGFIRLDYRSASDGVVVDVAAGMTTEDGDGGADTFSGIDEFRGSNFGDLLLGSESADRFITRPGDDTVDGRGGVDLVRYDRSGVAQIEANLETGTVQGVWDNTNFLDSVVNVENLRGSSGHDSIVGSAESNSVGGGGGNDLVELGLGDDTADGGEGVDTLTFASLQDPGFVFGNTEFGVFANLSTQGTAQNTGAGLDTFENFENLEGSQFGDLLTGDGAANTLTGLGGGDVLNGGDGDDVLLGGEGFDAIEGGAGADQLFGGTGGAAVEGDIATYFSATGPLVFDFGATTSEIQAGSSAEVLEDTIGADIEGVAGAGGHSNTFLGDELTGLTFFLGGSEADTFVGGSGVDQLIGLGGDDVMYGNDGGDALIGEGGDDDLFGGTGSDVFFFDGINEGDDTIHDLELGLDLILFTDGNVTSLTFADIDADGDGVDDTMLTYFVGATANGTITIIDHDAATVKTDANIIGVTDIGLG